MLAGFTILSVFGIGGFVNVNGESILSCVAKSAGIVSCDSGNSSFSAVDHESSALEALLAVVISTIVVLAVSLVVVFIFTLRDVAANFFISLERILTVNISLFRLKSWISLFELSPGK